MKNSTLIKSIVLFIVFFFPFTVVAGDAFLNGTVYIVSPESESPMPASSYQVKLYDTQLKKSLNPSVTDAYGRFAFFGVRKGKYLLDVVQTAKNWTHRLWRQDVTAPGTVRPIVLSQSASIIPHAKYTEVMGSKDTYDFSLWLDVPNKQKNRIKKVIYVFNHPTFKNKEFVSNNQTDGFKVGYRGWGCLSNVTIKIQGKDGGESLILLNMCGALENF